MRCKFANMLGRNAIALGLSICYLTAIYLFALAASAGTALAHEHWILTHKQIVEWNSKPKPALGQNPSATMLPQRRLSPAADIPPAT